MLLGSLSFTACNDGDDEDTNQYTGGISLNVFGPSPVARGGELRFLGSGMNQVTAVVIPGCSEITDITVVSNEEIRVTVPQTAEPGYVTLKTPNGDIVTKTKLTYSEPISLESFSPATIKPGAALTLKGEYLNLIQEIIFADNVIVPAAQFASQSRSEIKVVVPAEAQSGKIIISDTSSEDTEAIPNWIYSESELAVILPAVAEIADLSGKKPGDEVTFEGTDFDLITKVTMPNGDEVEYTVADNKLTFVLPENISDGAISVYAASGVAVIIATIGVALPSEVVAEPATELRGGDVITLTGVNMELITNITFPGVADAVALDAQSETEVKVTMPEAATSGNILLNTNSGVSVEVAIETQKPVFESFANDAVALASQVTIQGKNMDLVVKVTFTGGAEVTEFTTATESEVTLTMPSMQVETGVLTLTMANGETVETASLTINAPEACYIPELPGEDVELKGGEVWIIEVANGDKLTGVQIDGANVDYLLNGNMLYINVPQMANANSMVKLISSNGELEYAVAFIPATKIKNVVWSGLVDITWGDGGRVLIPASAFNNVPAGAKMTLCYAQKDQVWAQAQVNYADWSGINFTEGDVQFNQTLIPTDVYGWEFNNRETTLILTQEILDNIQAKTSNEGDFAGIGIIIQGSDLVFSQVYLEWEISLEQNIANCLVRQDDQSQNISLPMGITWDDSGRFRVLIDKEPSIKDMKLVAGKSIMNFYVSGTGQLQINDANWSSFTTIAEWDDAADKKMELVLTQEMVDWLTGVKTDGWSSTGMIIQGDGFTLNKVTILP